MHIHMHIGGATCIDMHGVSLCRRHRLGRARGTARFRPEATVGATHCPPALLTEAALGATYCPPALLTVQFTLGSNLDGRGLTDSAQE